LARRSHHRNSDRANDLIPKNIKYLELLERALGRSSSDVLHGRYINYLDMRYYTSGNPCFVWEAIYWLRQRELTDQLFKLAGSIERLLDLTPVDQVKLEIQAESYISDVPLLLPGWCINALARWASTISLNSFGNSITNTLKYAKSYASLLGKRSELDKLIQLRASRSRDLSARQAVDQIHSSFEFTKRGWNALDECQREIMALNVEQVFIFTKRNGISADEVYAQMAEEIGIDERNVRRLVAYGRKIVRDLERCIDPQNDET
jgi:hypothetical protein